MNDLLSLAEPPRPKASRGMTAAMVRAALKRRYPHPDFHVVFEVAHSTGHMANRHLDAVAMCLWPSRGLEIHGIEIKVSMGDFRREIAQPEKAEEIARFCDRFWIAAPAGMVPIIDLPPAWGLYDVTDEGGIDAVKVASKHNAQPVGKPFLAAMMRAAGRRIDDETIDAVVAKRVLELEQRHAQDIRAEVARRSRDRDAGEKNWRALCEALGEDPGLSLDDTEIIAAIKAVRASGVAATWSGLRALLTSAEDFVARVRGAGGDMMLDLPRPKPVPRRKA